MDLRVDLILRVEQDHLVSSVATDRSSHGEHWQCRCGEKYKGKGSISNGRRHVATEVLSALDAAGAVA